MRPLAPWRTDPLQDEAGGDGAFRAQAPVVKDSCRTATSLAPLAVQKMLALKAPGWGSQRISRALGCSRNTVRVQLRRGLRAQALATVRHATAPRHRADTPLIRPGA
jgi:DNA-directed RNA polymerase specialized sigma24 family protein